MSKAMAWLWKELRAMIPAMIFFLIAFHMLSVTKALLLDNYDITPTSSTIATVSAIIVAKTILLIDHTALARSFSNRLLYNLLWKTVLFGTIAVLFRQVEELIPVVLKHGDLGAAIREHLSSVSSSRFLIIHMWLYTLLFIYALMSEAVRMLGRDGARAVLLGPVRPHAPHGEG
ncbi:MAG: hypothetical protein OEV95_12755 [Gemmatimonadota bacterium]|jgi:hypothetical protein|nr:hypothetical protein [Gemmatimonadota bacterium]